MPNQYSSKNKYVVDGNVLRVYDCNNKEILFDLEDKDLLQLDRYVYYVGKNGYATNKTLGYAHRLVMNAPQDLQIDHDNRIRTDNRKSNLRLSTNQENNFNKEAKGYYWAKHANKWGACIGLNGKTIFLGYYNTEIEAGEAYKFAKNKYHIRKEY